MRISYASQADAAAACDQIHRDKIATDAAYAESVKRGFTTGWAAPYQDLDGKGNPITTDWWVTVDDRVKDVVEPAKAATVAEWVDPTIDPKQLPALTTAAQDAWVAARPAMDQKFQEVCTKLGIAKVDSQVQDIITSSTASSI